MSLYIESVLGFFDETARADEMTTNEKSKSPLWSWEENKAFEVAVTIHAEDRTDRWERIAAAVPGRTIAEIKHHYQRLVDDIRAIEGGLDPLPPYLPRKSAAHTGRYQGISHHGGKGSSRSNQERRKGIAWTEDEHRLFLLGLSKYGKGDWRSISRKFVVSRTPAQVASHAQKYFIRLESNKRRRSSIHDITNVGNEDILGPQESIIDQSNGPIGATGESIKQSCQPPSSTSEGGTNSNKRRRSSIYDITGVGNGDILVPQAPITSQPNKPTREQSSPPPSSTFGVYGPLTIGQPIGESLVSATCTPVPAPPHMAYDVGAPYRWDHCSWFPNEHSSNDISNPHITED